MIGRRSPPAPGSRSLRSPRSSLFVAAGARGRRAPTPVAVLARAPLGAGLGLALVEAGGRQAASSAGDGTASGSCATSGARGIRP